MSVNQSVLFGGIGTRSFTIDHHVEGTIIHRESRNSGYTRWMGVEQKILFWIFGHPTSNHSVYGDIYDSTRNKLARRVFSPDPVTLVPDSLWLSSTRPTFPFLMNHYLFAGDFPIRKFSLGSFECYYILPTLLITYMLFDQFKVSWMVGALHAVAFFLRNKCKVFGCNADWDIPLQLAIVKRLCASSCKKFYDVWPCTS